MRETDKIGVAALHPRLGRRAAHHAVLLPSSRVSHSRSGLLATPCKRPLLASLLPVSAPGPPSPPWLCTHPHSQGARACGPRAHYALGCAARTFAHPARRSLLAGGTLSASVACLPNTTSRIGPPQPRACSRCALGPGRPNIRGGTPRPIRAAHLAPPGPPGHSHPRTGHNAPGCASPPPAPTPTRAHSAWGARSAVVTRATRGG
jgi:hypothetical protein